MIWLIARYYPVGLFSLKHGEATSTGGKSLLLPTPFAIRTALVDAALRVEGREQAEDIVGVIRSLRLALKPPTYAAVSALFTKVLKPQRADSAKAGEQFFQKTIAFREYVHWWGTLGLAFGGNEADLTRVWGWLPHVTYLGKRGGFIQLAAPPEQVSSLPEGYLRLEAPDASEAVNSVDLPSASSAPSAFPLGLVQRMDDWGPEMTWPALNVFSKTKIRLGKERIRYDVVTPYTLAQAGRGFALYVLET